MKKNSSLEISGLSVNVIVGCYDFEKTQKQKIEIDVLMQFRNIPQTLLSDNLSDGICYNEMVKRIENYADSHSHETIEKWCYEIFQLIKIHYNNISHLQIKIKKKPADIRNLQNGVIFSYSEDM